MTIVEWLSIIGVCHSVSAVGLSTGALLRWKNMGEGVMHIYLLWDVAHGK